MSNITIRDKFIKASLWSGLSMYFFFVFNFTCQLFFSRLLSPAVIGLFAFGIAVREMIGMVSILAMPGGYIKSEGKQSDFDAYMLLTVCAVALQMLVSIILAFYYFIHEHNEQLATVIILLGISQCFIMWGQV